MDRFEILYIGSIIISEQHIKISADSFLILVEKRKKPFNQ